MVEHIRTQHREYASPGNSNNRGRLPIPAGLWIDSVEIQPKEYVFCGIDASLIPPHFDHICETPRSPVLTSTPSGGKRSRAFTATTTDVPASKQARHY